MCLVRIWDYFMRRKLLLLAAILAMGLGMLCIRQYMTQKTDDHAEATESLEVPSLGTVEKTVNGEVLGKNAMDDDKYEKNAQNKATVWGELEAKVDHRTGQATTSTPEPSWLSMRDILLLGFGTLVSLGLWRFISDHYIR